MFKKVYENIKKYIIKNHNFILFIILLVLVLNIKLPYVINAPGGIMSLSDRVKVNGKNINNNYYTTYVSVIDGNVASVLASFVMPNWDLEKYEEYSGDSGLTYDELTKAEKLAMRDGNNKAKIVALEKAGVNYELKNSKLYVYFKFEDYENELFIGDEITKCNNKKVETAEQLSNCINESRNEVDLEIIRNNKTKNITVPTYFHEDTKIIGVILLNDFDIVSDYDIEIRASKSESGSSGSFMTALSLYDGLSNLNLSKKYKISGTGTIDTDGNIGKIAGIKYKLIGAAKKRVDIFFCPEENYAEAKKYKKKYNLKLKLVMVKNIDDAINYLNNLKK